MKDEDNGNVLREKVFKLEEANRQLIDDASYFKTNMLLKEDYNRLVNMVTNNRIALERVETEAKGTSAFKIVLVSAVIAVVINLIVLFSGKLF